MLTLYGIPNCNSVKKAIDFLNAKKIDFSFHNYKKSGISRDKLEEWLLQIPLDKIVNKQGTTFKKLSDEEKAEFDSPHSAIPLIMEKTSIIKRPIIEDQKIVALGFDAEKYETIFKDF